MIQQLTALCLIGVVFGQQVPHGHDLTMMIDHGFDRLDTDHNNVVTFAEYDAIERNADANNDSCVSREEFGSNRPHAPAEVLTVMFLHFDHDHNGCIKTDDLVAEYHTIDGNSDGSVSRHEFDQYYKHLITQLLNTHGGHVVG